MKKVEEGAFVTSQELEEIQQMNSEFQKMKNSLGDIELQKHSILKHIDIKTGEITKKEKQDG
jgi:predicted transcriptional regulator